MKAHLRLEVPGIKQEPELSICFLFTRILYTVRDPQFSRIRCTVKDQKRDLIIVDDSALCIGYIGGSAKGYRYVDDR
jgi:hypothetical protein